MSGKYPSWSVIKLGISVTENVTSKQISRTTWYTYNAVPFRGI